MNEDTIRKAMQGQAFNTYNSVSEIENVIRWKVFDAMRMRGQSGVDETTIQTICRKVSDVILRDYPAMTDVEFDVMLEAGISGELTPKETWVSGAMILQWMRLYYRHASRINIIDEQTEAEHNRKRKTKAEVEELNQKAYEGCFNNAREYLRENGTIIFKDDEKRKDDARAIHLPHWAAMVYDEYRRRGVIPVPTDGQKLEADMYAEVKMQEKPTKPQYVKASIEDWQKAHLLELYYNNTI